MEIETFQFPNMKTPERRLDGAAEPVLSFAAVFSPPPEPAKTLNLTELSQQDAAEPPAAEPAAPAPADPEQTIAQEAVEKVPGAPIPLPQPVQQMALSQVMTEQAEPPPSPGAFAPVRLSSPGAERQTSDVPADPKSAAVPLAPPSSDEVRGSAPHPEEPDQILHFAPGPAGPDISQLSAGAAPSTGPGTPAADSTLPGRPAPVSVAHDPSASTPSGATDAARLVHAPPHAPARMRQDPIQQDPVYQPRSEPLAGLPGLAEGTVPAQGPRKSEPIAPPSSPGLSALPADRHPADPRPAQTAGPQPASAETRPDPAAPKANPVAAQSTASSGPIPQPEPQPVASAEGDAQTAISGSPDRLVLSQTQPQTTPQVLRADAPNLPQRMADILVTQAGQTVELSLRPEELGRVRMSMSLSEAGTTVVVSAERPETLDLMRRHAETLADALRQAGHGSIDFAFHQQNRNPDVAETETAGRDGQDDTAEVLTQTVETPVRRLHLGSGLDIRL